MASENAIAVLLLNGSLVLFMGMVVGVPYGVLRAKDARPESHENWRISHSQNIQNGMLLLLVAACVPHVELSEPTLRAMVYLLVVAAYTDMAAWLIRPITGQSGLLPAGPPANLAVFALFGITVVGQFGGIALLIWGAWSRYALVPST